MDSKSHRVTNQMKAITLQFLGGASAGWLTFMLFAGVWQISHYWLVMTLVTLLCGMLAVVYRQNFEKMFTALMDNPPWF
jgi:hypothetical protein